MKEKVLVTGASSGIGQAICKWLKNKNYEVWGIGRTFSEMEEENFHPISLDLTDLKNVERVITELRKTYDFSILIQCAGVGYYGLHEQIKSEHIAEMVTVNVTVPMIISKIMLPVLKKNKGTIIQISSYTAHEANPHGCAYGATKAALSSFGKSLFVEERKYDLKVVNIEPEMTKTNLYRNADFDVSEEEGACLYTEDVVSAVAYILSQPSNVCVNTITLSPQKTGIRRKK